MARPIAHVCLVLTLAAGTAAAAPQKDPNVVRAEKHKADAFKKLERGDFAGGIASMEEAYRLVAHPGFLLNIAIAYEQWGGHCKEGLATYERFRSVCNSGCELEKGGADRESKLRELCTAQVALTSEPPGAAITIDGAPAGQTPVTVPLVAGTHEARGTLEGHEPLMRVIEVADGSRMEVSLPLVRLQPNAAAADAATAVSTRAPPGEGEIPTAYIMFGVAGAGAVAGVVFAILTSSAVDEERAARRVPLPKAEVESIQGQAVRNAVLSYVGFGIALAGAAAGGVLLVLDAQDEDATSVALRLGPGSLGLEARF